MKSIGIILGMIMNYEWNVLQQEYDSSNNLAKYNLSFLEKSFIQNRKIDCDEFLNGKISDYIEDRSLIDLDKILIRLKNAIHKKEKIAILGDYDVDGISSTAMFMKLFNNYKIDYEVKIPNREDGYGHSIDTVSNLDASLVIMLDCGSGQDFSSIDKDICIIDHHQTAPESSVYAFVNPQRSDLNKKYQKLCTAGLAFIVIYHLSQDLNKEIQDSKIQDVNLNFDCKKLLDLVALGTIGDCMNLIELNRAYIKYGLSLIKLNKDNLEKKFQQSIESHSVSTSKVTEKDFSNEYNGINILVEMKMNKYNNKITSGFIAFQICPCINAAGRLGESHLALDLLSKDNEYIVNNNIAEQLVSLNERRKEIEKECCVKLIHMIEEDFKNQEFRRVDEQKFNKICLIAEDPKYHPGLVGILASRLKSKFRVPAFVFYKRGDLWKGSARSIEGLDIGAIITDSNKLGFSLNGGGHAMAGGITIHEDQYQNWKSFIYENIDNYRKGNYNVNLIDIDCTMTMNGIFQDGIVKNIVPFGNGNEAPNVLVKNVLLQSAEVCKSALKLSFDENGFTKVLFAFDWACHHKDMPIGKLVDVVFSVDESSVRIIDMKLPQE